MTPKLDLDVRLDSWAGDRLWRHLVALGLIGLVALVRWHHCVLLDGPLIDEATYLAAFRAVAEGRSPYEVGSFHYTPLFAWVGARCVETLGETGALAALRGLSLGGLALAVWCSTAWLAVSWSRRLALATVFVALAPAVGAGLCAGNVSFAVIGVILLALTQWSRRSWLAGALPSGLALGATVAAKPLAPLALVALFFHRGPEGTGSARPRQQPTGRLAATAGLGVAALLLLPMVSQLAAMSAQPIHPLSYARSFSLQRLLSLVGLEVSPLAVVAIVALLVVWLVRTRPLGRSGLLAVATTAAVLSTPIIWNHTLLLALPLQGMALSLALARRRAATGERLLHYELILVLLGVLALQFSEGFGAVDEFPSAVQATFLLVPYLAPAALLAYVLRFDSVRRNR